MRPIINPVESIAASRPVAKSVEPVSTAASNSRTNSAGPSVASVTVDGKKPVKPRPTIRAPIANGQKPSDAGPDDVINGDGPNTNGGKRPIRPKLAASPVEPTAYTPERNENGPKPSNVDDVTNGKNPTRTPPARLQRRRVPNPKATATPANTEEKSATTADRTDPLTNGDTDATANATPIRRRPRPPLVRRRPVPIYSTADEANIPVRPFGESPLDLLLVNHSARLATGVTQTVITEGVKSCFQKGENVTVQGPAVALYPLSEVNERKENEFEKPNEVEKTEIQAVKTVEEEDYAEEEEETEDECEEEIEEEYEEEEKEDEVCEVEDEEYEEAEQEEEEVEEEYEEEGEDEVCEEEDEEEEEEVEEEAEEEAEDEVCEEEEEYEEEAEQEQEVSEEEYEEAEEDFCEEEVYEEYEEEAEEAEEEYDEE